MTEQELQQLVKDVQYLKDRQSIIDCIARNARGCDRFDIEVLSNSYSEDGIDEHGTEQTVPGPDYPKYANPAHEAMCVNNMHNITTHTCEIDGDVAHAESYTIGLFMDKDNKGSRLLAGRYLDRLERRNGEWKIVLRRCTVEVEMTGDAPMIAAGALKEMGYLNGLRDKSDLSYQRPLRLEETPEGHRW